MNSSDQTRLTHDDSWLIKLFKDVTILAGGSKADVNWSLSTDFEVFSKFFIADVREMQKKLQNAGSDDLYWICRRIFNIVDWIKLMVETGFKTFPEAFEGLFVKEFGDGHVLQNMYDACFEKWMSQVSGQQRVGDNFYNIHEGGLFYRDRFGRWFEVDRTTAFDLKPNKTPVEDAAKIHQLNREYKETPYDAILRRWTEKDFEGRLSDHFLRFDEVETSPEEYFDFSTGHVQQLLNDPVSVQELERWYGEDVADLEEIVKMSLRVLETVKRRRADDTHTVYLLRDCLMFYELHKALDLLESKGTSADQLLIGRKLLSYKGDDGGYYVVTLQILYYAHQRYPENFADFYDEYARLMDTFVSLNPGFAASIASLAEYVKEHVVADKNNVVVFDIGFQGSIAILTKYVIDRHVRPLSPNGMMETDVKVGVGALWSKELFQERQEDDYFPFLYHLQLATRSDELYHYKLGSLASGQLRVVMGDKNKQRKAAVELVVLLTVALLDRETAR